MRWRSKSLLPRGSLLARLEDMRVTKGGDKLALAGLEIAPRHAAWMILIESMVLSLICGILGVIGGTCLLSYLWNNVAQLGGRPSLLGELRVVTAAGLIVSCILSLIREALAMAFHTQVRLRSD